MQLEDYTNYFFKFQAHKWCKSRDIYIQKCVNFDGKFLGFHIPSILLTSDLVFIWLLIGQSQSVIIITIEQ